ncbi:endonuclease domain-containing protein [Microbacterium sp. PMB16]|uniref:endonuclease domain-containing protein n=1 Tax=Microbacterium sp. PMB16 TaxID=3120157 RepID=UPI003F4C61A0
MCGTDGDQVWTYRALRETMTRREIEHRMRLGSLARVRRGVYAGAQACAPVLAAAAHGGALGCESAARHLGLWVLGDPEMHVWMHADRHQYSHDGRACTCVVHWDEGDAPSPFALPAVPRILLQIFRCRGGEHFFVALESARRKGAIDAGGLRWLRKVLSAKGRDLVVFSRGDSDSGLESLVRLRLRAYGWTVRTQAQIIGTGQVDLLIDGWLIVETDGRENHEGPSRRHKDLVRDANAALWGHATLRFDYAMVVHDWDLVERAVVATIRRA